jgi:hypothetical protein
MAIKKIESDICSRDHDLLIRIDEQIKLLLERLNTVEKTLQNNIQLYEENKSRIDKIETDLYGSNNIDGIYHKVEKHDKLLTKALAYFTVFAVAIEFVFKYLLK